MTKKAESLADRLKRWRADHMSFRLELRTLHRMCDTGCATQDVRHRMKLRGHDASGGEDSRSDD